MLEKKRLLFTTSIVFFYALSYYICLLFFKDNQSFKLLEFKFFEIIAPALAIFFIYLNFGKFKGKERKFWILMLISCLSYFISELFWISSLKQIMSGTYIFGWADLFRILNLLLYSYALVYKIYSHKEKYRILQLTIDAGIFLTVWITLSWIYFLKPVFYVNLIVPLGYSIAHICILITTILIFFYYKEFFSPIVLFLNLSAMMTFIIIDTIFLYRVIFASFDPFNYLVPVWGICILLIGLSSFFKDNIIHEDDGKSRKEGLKKYSIIIPYGSVVLLVGFSLLKTKQIFDVSIGLAIVLGLILIRQIIILYENTKLVRQLQHWNETLEYKVMERTLELNAKNKELSFLNSNLEEIVYERTQKLVEIQHKLSISEQRYRSLFENHPDNIVLFNLDGILVEANCKTGGNNSEQIELLKIYLDKALSGKSQSFEASLSNEDMSRVDYNITLVPVLIDHKVEGIFGIYHDISEKKRTEEILRKTEKLDIVSHLAASISHEVRNPLTTSRGFLQLLVEEAELQTKKQYLDIAIKEIDRATEIINDYLMFAKPAPEKKEKIDVYTDVQHSIKVISPLANMNGIQINFTIPKNESCYVYGEKGKFQQCLVNILKNGIEAMPSGGELQVLVVSTNLDIQIKIIDSGIGMSQDQINHLGEPYFTTKGKGTGLGMMVSFSIIKAMNANIKVESKLKKGTCFTIQIPKSICLSTEDVMSKAQFA